jgi:hypothetical protein
VGDHNYWRRPSCAKGSFREIEENRDFRSFERIVGNGPGQIPPGAAIHSAKLYVSAFDQGDTVHIHRMLVPWQRQATWSTLVAGVTADGTEASRHRESFTFGKIAANSSLIPFDVTDSVQAWVKGTANFGWVFINTRGNGLDFYTCEFDDVKQRPKRVVEPRSPRAPQTSKPLWRQPWSPRRPPGAPSRRSSAWPGHILQAPTARRQPTP